jgi:hypothetical protein
MIFISYYTKKTPYEKVMKTYLLPSLKKWKLKYKIEGIKNLGNWQKNTHYKAKFIKKMLLKYKQPVIFLDADATIEKYPYLFWKLEELNYDIGLHYLDWYLFWRKQSGQMKREALSGTLFLNYNKKVLKFLDKWIKENNESTQWEQRNMEKILDRQFYLKVYDLPPKYTCIKLRNGQIPIHYVKSPPVIIHHQVSRQYKNE